METKSKIKEMWKNIKYGIRNFWKFRKVIWNFRDWDCSYNLDILRLSLVFTRDGIHNRKIIEDYKEVFDEINEFLELTDGKKFFDVCNEWNNYLNRSEIKFTKCANNKELFELNVKNNSNISKERIKILANRAWLWEDARWNRAWKLFSEKAQGWWD